MVESRNMSTGLVSLHLPSIITCPQVLQLTIINHEGRTARIGNEGIATSFYNERDEDIASDLVKILMECEQPVPDFLQGFAPSDNVLVFDDDTENEEEKATDAEAGASRQYGEPEVNVFELGKPQPAPAATEVASNEAIPGTTAKQDPSAHDLGGSQWAPSEEPAW